MNIAVIEDNENDYIALKKAINNFFVNVNITYSLKRYNYAIDLYHDIYDIDFVFLDIEFNEQENGIEVGIKIRDLRYDIFIVFISNYSQYLIDGYKAQANRYLEKPIQQSNFNIEMHSILKKYLFQYSSIYDPKISLQKIYFKDILYIEFVTRKSEIHFQNGSVLRTHYQLKDWMKQLPKQYFGQVYRSIIVNFMYVCGTAGNYIILSDNEKVPLSKTYKDDFKQKYLKYVQWRI